MNGLELAATKGEEMAALLDRQAELQRKLSYAMRLQAFAPGLFNHGAARHGFLGPQPEHLREWPLEEWSLHLTDGAGKDSFYPLGEVPLALVPDSIAKRPEFKRLANDGTAGAWRDGERAALEGESIMPWAGRNYPHDSRCGRAFRAGHRTGARRKIKESS